MLEAEVAPGDVFAGVSVEFGSEHFADVVEAALHGVEGRAAIEAVEVHPVRVLIPALWCDRKQLAVGDRFEFGHDTTTRQGHT